ncbi:MAG: YkgJ family cysteine cluster protein [Pseudomonadota bacterium]|jgi:Fe-S-cluster containining protein
MSHINNDLTQYDCDCCGACCKTFPVLVSIGDAQREPRIKDEARRLPDWQRSDEWEYQLHPLPFLSACPFLGANNHCAVYPTRPDPCRRFSAGSAECLAARARVGLEPLRCRLAG